jgi:nitroreductase
MALASVEIIRSVSVLVLVCYERDERNRRGGTTDWTLSLQGFEAADLQSIGACVENMLLTATSKGLGACWIGSVDRDRVRHILGIPEEFSIHSIVAVGHPAQESVWEEKNSESIKYYLDDENKLHVPKRRMGEILVPITPHID